MILSPLPNIPNPYRTDPPGQPFRPGYGARVPKHVIRVDSIAEQVDWTQVFEVVESELSEQLIRDVWPYRLEQDGPCGLLLELDSPLAVEYFSTFPLPILFEIVEGPIDFNIPDLPNTPYRLIKFEVGPPSFRQVKGLAAPTTNAARVDMVQLRTEFRQQNSRLFQDLCSAAGANWQNTSPTSPTSRIPNANEFMQTRLDG